MSHNGTTLIETSVKSKSKKISLMMWPFPYDPLRSGQKIGEGVDNRSTPIILIVLVLRLFLSIQANFKISGIPRKFVEKPCCSVFSDKYSAIIFPLCLTSFLFDYFITLLYICDALRDLVSFVQFKKNAKNTHGEMILQVEAFNFTKSNTPQSLFFTLFKLYKQ